MLPLSWHVGRRWERCTACWHIRHLISVRFCLPFCWTSSSCVPKSQGEGFQEKRCWKLNLWPELAEGANMYSILWYSVYACKHACRCQITEKTKMLRGNMRHSCMMFHNVAGLWSHTGPHLRCETHPSGSCIISLPRWASDQITMDRNSLTRPLTWDSCTVRAQGKSGSSNRITMHHTHTHYITLWWNE